MLADSGDIRPMLEADALDADEVAEIVVRGLAEEKFLILPHPQVAEYFQQNASCTLTGSTR